MTTSPQEKFLALLEQFDLHKQKIEGGSLWKVISGIVIGLLGLIGIGAFVWFNIANGPSVLFYFLLAVGLLLSVLGGTLAISGMSDEKFTQLNIRIQRLSSWGLTVAQVVLFLPVAAFSALFCYYMVMPELANDDIYACVTIGSMILFLAYGVYSLGSGPVAVGVQSIKSKFISRQSSVILESLSLACVFVAIVFLVGRLEGSVASLSLALVLALVSYFGFRVNMLDHAYSETRNRMDKLKWEAWRSYCKSATHGQACYSLSRRVASSSGGRDDGSEGLAAVLTAYRNLSELMDQSSSFSRRPVSFFGIKALCDVADARELRLSSSEGVLMGDRRIKCGNEILEMSDRDFFYATAKIFDGFVRMLDLNQKTKFADPPQRDGLGVQDNASSLPTNGEGKRSELRRCVNLSRMAPIS